MPLWRNRLARSAVNRKVGGSNPPRGAEIFIVSTKFVDYYILQLRRQLQWKTNRK